MTDWLYMPPWGMRLVALAGAVLVALVAARAVRERRLVRLRRQGAALALRCLAIGALVWVALNPTAMRPHEVPGKPCLTVLLDTSFSMATADSEGEGRLASALGVLQDERVRAALERDFTLDVRCFDREPRPANLAALSDTSADGRASDIGAALSVAVTDQADRPLQAGVLLVSDGRATAAGAADAARLALARSVPLWTWCLGGEVPHRDLWIEVPASEVLAFAGAEVELSATLCDTGYENRAFRVEVLKDGRVVEAVDAVPGPEGRAPVKAKVTAPPQGEHHYVFRAVEDPAEATKDNNERSVFLRIVGEKVRVLLVEGQPHWDTKFLVQCLKRDARVELTALYRLAAERQFAVVSAEGDEKRRERADLFPRSADEFARYDVIIMGRGCEVFFDEKTEEHLGDFVARHGGALVFSRGKAYGGRFQPLAKLEPVVWGAGVTEGVRLVPTRLGRACPVFELGPAGEVEALFARLPVLDRATHTVGVKPLAVVLAGGDPASPGESAAPPGRSPAAAADEDEGPAVMAYHLYGQGRVVTLNASGLWRWAFSEKPSEGEEFVYERFWSAMLRWLLAGSDFLAGADVALRSERRLYTDEQQVELLVRTRGLDPGVYRPQLSIRGPVLASAEPGSARAAPAVAADLEPRPQQGGAYVAEAGPFAPGTYQVHLRNNVGAPPEMTLTVEVASASVENRVLSADPDLMRRLAETSEGRTVKAADVPRLGEIVRQWRARRELAEQKVTLWDHWLLLAATLAVLAAEWYLRRREGLL